MRISPQLESREIGHGKGAVIPRAVHSLYQGRPVVPRRAYNSLMENRLSPITFLGEEPFCPAKSSTG
jgi:hypothetical protein